MSGTGTWTRGMRFLIKPLIPRPRPASRLHLGPGRWIFDALEVNGQTRRWTRIPKTTRRISLPRIPPLMHHQVGPNPLRHSPKRNRTIVLIVEDPDNKAKVRILLPLALTPLLSGKTRSKIRTRKIYLILSATPISKKVIMPISIPKRSQKTTDGLDNFHVSD